MSDLALMDLLRHLYIYTAVYSSISHITLANITHMIQYTTYFKLKTIQIQEVITNILFSPD